MANPETSVTPVEILAAIPAKVAGQAAAVLTVRMNPLNSYVLTHLSVSMQQAERLRQDLTTLLEHDQPIWSE